MLNGCHLLKRWGSSVPFMFLVNPSFVRTNSVSAPIGLFHSRLWSSVLWHVQFLNTQLHFIPYAFPFPRTCLDIVVLRIPFISPSIIIFPLTRLRLIKLNFLSSNHLEIFLFPFIDTKYYHCHTWRSYILRQPPHPYFSFPNNLPPLQFSNINLFLSEHFKQINFSYTWSYFATAIVAFICFNK